jgi:hypothetical protein
MLKVVNPFPNCMIIGSVCGKLWLYVTLCLDIISFHIQQFICFFRSLTSLFVGTYLQFPHINPMQKRWRFPMPPLIARSIVHLATTKVVCKTYVQPAENSLQCTHTICWLCLTKFVLHQHTRLHKHKKMLGKKLPTTQPSAQSAVDLPEYYED